MDRNTAFYRGTGRVENFEFQKIGLNEFGRIKAEAKRRNVIKGKNHKVTYADHIVSGLAAASPEDVCHCVKNKQDAGNDLEQNERPPTVVFQRMPGQQKHAGLQAKEGQAHKDYNADFPNAVVHSFCYSCPSNVAETLKNEYINLPQFQHNC